MRHYPVLLLCFSVVSQGYSYNSATQSIPLNWNHVVDFILQEARDEILRENLDEVPLEDARETFRRRWGFILIDAEFTATQGSLRSLSSLERRGDATVVVQNSRYTLTCEMGLREAKVRYGKYDVSMWGSSILNGEIKGDIAVNTLRAVLDFDLTATGCVPSLREFKVTQVGGFEIKVSGLGPLDDLTSQISTWVSKNREGQIIKEMEYYLSKEIRKALETFDCGQYSSLLLL